MSIRTTPEGLVRRVTTLLRRMETRTSKALVKTANDSVPMIRKRTPKAFGELQQSIHVENFTTGLVLAGAAPSKNVLAKTVVDAPHAKAVEIGSPPHEPDMKKLKEWVRLRNIQGRTKTGRLRRSWPSWGSKAHFEMGITTPRQAMRVARAVEKYKIRSRRATKRRDAQGQTYAADAIDRVTEAIAKGIRLHGTRPHFMVRGSIIEIAANMGRLVRTAVKGTPT